MQFLNLKVLLPILLSLFTQGCVSFVYMAIQDRFPDDAYPIDRRVKQPPNNNGIKDLKQLDQLEIGKTTFEEALQLLGDGYKYRLTFEPPYKRKYAGKFYEVRYFLHYWYDGHIETHMHRISLFFDTNHKLAFTYLVNEGYPEEKEYHNIPESTPQNQKRYFWPYGSCDLKYYQKISNPVMDKIDGYTYDDYYCEWEEDYYKDKPKPNRREKKIFDWREDR